MPAAMIGELLTQWTIRPALALYVAWLADWLMGLGPRWPAVARWVWTAACGLFLIHVVCAFQFYHGWSHAAAWHDTAEQTKALLGVAFGDGIYFSYLFMALWVLDVGWMWLTAAPRRTPVPRRTLSPRRTLWPRVLVHCFLFFIAFNGAIVFESGPTRWFGLAACLGLTALACRRAYHSWQAADNIPNVESVTLTPDS
jgi:hypothetical protein